MKDTSTHITVQFLTEVYVTYRPLVLRYITGKLNGCLEAEDLVQDAFLRLLEYRSMLRPETVRSFLYTIVRNLVTDYLRRHYKKQEVIACMQERLSASVVDTESQIIVRIFAVKSYLCFNSYLLKLEPFIINRALMKSLHWK